MLVLDLKYLLISWKVSLNFKFIIFFIYTLIIFLNFIVGEAFYYLDAPVIRVTGADIPMPYTKSLEIAALPQTNDIVEAAKKILGV